MSEETADSYQLVYEGLEQDSAQSLIKLRAALISDLELSVEDAKKVLEQFPTTIKTASTEAELTRFYEVLKKAGAKVLLVKPKSEGASSEPAVVAEEVVIELDEALTPPPGLSLEEDGETELEFDLEESIVPKKTEKPPKVHALDMEDAAPLFSFEESVKAEDKPETPPSKEELATQALLELGAEPDFSNEPEAPPKKEEPKETIDLSLSFEEPVKPPPPPKESQPLLDSHIDLPPMEEKPESKPEVSLETETPQPVQKPPPSAVAAKAQPLASIPPAAKPAIDEIVIQDKPLHSKKKNKSIIPLDIAIPAGIGIIIIGIGNWLFFTAQNSGIASNDIEKLLGESSAQVEHGERSPEKTSLPKLPILSGKAQYKDRALSFDFTIHETELVNALIRITTPAPPPLTPSEIVLKKVAPPWLREVTISHFTINPNETGSFYVVTPARVYIEDGGQRKRIMAEAQIGGKFLPKQSLVEISVKVSKGVDDEAKSNAKFFIERDNSGGYRLYIDGEAQTP